ncbi:MAG: deoxyguanosinetriphosphate triphosphohydrolase [Deltaproteobacteria bacterium]|nr:deoxyguanosinetriphosphate triphosphohydrolase [Deltaproteobacteria bacterium]
MLARDYFEKQEAERLAPYGLRSAESRGRRYPEEEHPLRMAYQRDRDRVIHCSAFRRLEYKTQVFVNHEGDHYRTRLTHTMEGSQIARTMARALRLNEDLAEAIVLAHDLGHTPFGHSGERALGALMKDHGGFEHNEQSLRIVEVLEERYPGFKGLNLTFETLEGIQKHRSSYDGPGGETFHQPALEGQLADLSDEIAYNNHDIDDGIASGMLDQAALGDVVLWRENHAEATRRLAGAEERLIILATIRSLIDLLVSDAIRTTESRLTELGIGSADDVRRCAERIVGFSGEVEEKKAELKAFLYDNLYRHTRVIRMGTKAERILEDLFNTYLSQPEQMPSRFVSRLSEGDEIHRVIADYIAGMTDRYAMDEHKKLFDPHERV